MHGIFHGVSILGLLICLFSLLGPFGAAATYALRPRERTLALMRPLSLASMFAGLTGFLIGIANELAYVSERAPDGVTRNAILMGLAQSTVPLFVTFGFLAVAWLLIAIGQQRQEPA